MRLRPSYDPLTLAAATRALGHFYWLEAQACGCPRLSAASELCFRRARKLDREARQTA
jgi:hypothetical protein